MLGVVTTDGDAANEGADTATARDLRAGERVMIDEGAEPIALTAADGSQVRSRVWVTGRGADRSLVVVGDRGATETDLRRLAVAALGANAEARRVVWNGGRIEYRRFDGDALSDESLGIARVLTTLAADPFEGRVPVLVGGDGQWLDIDGVVADSGFVAAVRAQIVAERRLHTPNLPSGLGFHDVRPDRGDAETDTESARQLGLPDDFHPSPEAFDDAIKKAADLVAREQAQKRKAEIVENDADDPPAQPDEGGGRDSDTGTAESAQSADWAERCATAAEVGEELQRRHTGIEVAIDEFRATQADVETVREFGRAIDDILTKYPEIDLREVHIRELAGDQDFVVSESVWGASHSACSMVLNERSASSEVRQAATAALPSNFTGRPVYLATVRELGLELVAAVDRQIRGATIGAQAREAMEGLFEEALGRATRSRPGRWGPTLNAWMRLQFSDYVRNWDLAAAEAFAAVEAGVGDIRDSAKRLHSLITANVFDVYQSVAVPRSAVASQAVPGKDNDTGEPSLVPSLLAEHRGPVVDDWAAQCDTPQQVAAALEQRLRKRPHGTSRPVAVVFDNHAFDIELAREFARAVDHIFTRYPWIDLPEIRIDRLREPERGDGVIEHTYARAKRGYVNGELRYTSALIFNQKFAFGLRQLENMMRADVESGFHAKPAERMLYGFIFHELGHAVDYAGGHGAWVGAEAELREYFHTTTGFDDDLRFQRWLRTQFSRYSFDEDGALNLHEAVAESFGVVELSGPQAATAGERILHRRLIDAAEARHESESDSADAARRTDTDIRRRVRQGMRGWMITEPDRMGLLLELTGAAVRHAHADARVAVIEHGVPGSRVIRVEISDSAPELPLWIEADEKVKWSDGRIAMDRIADMWGVDRRSDGKTVWFEFRQAPGAVSRPSTADSRKLATGQRVPGDLDEQRELVEEVLTGLALSDKQRAVARDRLLGALASADGSEATSQARVWAEHTDGVTRIRVDGLGESRYWEQFYSRVDVGPDADRVVSDLQAALGAWGIDSDIRAAASAIVEETLTDPFGPLVEDPVTVTEAIDPAIAVSVWRDDDGTVCINLDLQQGVRYELTLDDETLSYRATIGGGEGSEADLVLRAHVDCLLELVGAPRDEFGDLRGDNLGIIPGDDLRTVLGMDPIYKLDAGDLVVELKVHGHMPWRRLRAASPRPMVSGRNRPARSTSPHIRYAMCGGWFRIRWARSAHRPVIGSWWWPTWPTIPTEDTLRIQHNRSPFLGDTNFGFLNTVFVAKLAIESDEVKRICSNFAKDYVVQKSLVEEGEYYGERIQRIAQAQSNDMFSIVISFYNESQEGIENAIDYLEENIPTSTEKQMIVESLQALSIVRRNSCLRSLGISQLRENVSQSKILVDQCYSQGNLTKVQRAMLLKLISLGQEQQQTISKSLLREIIRLSKYEANKKRDFLEAKYKAKKFYSLLSYKYDCELGFDKETREILSD